MKNFGRLVTIAAAAGLALGLATSAQAQSNLTWTGEITGWLEGFQFPYSGAMPGGGTAVVSGVAPRTVNLAKNDFYDQGTYTVPSAYLQPGFYTSISYHTVYNGAAKFFAGGGPGAATFNPPAATPPRYGTIQVTPGGNQFGGTLALLGVWRSYIRQLTYFSSYIAGTISNPLGTTTPTGAPSLGRTVQAQGTFANTAYPSYTTTVKAIVSLGGWWTTGAVQVKAPAPLSNTTTTVTGYDNRTPGGLGNLQLVHGWLAHYSAGGVSYDDGAAYYVVNMDFSAPPLPSLSAPGIALLSLLILGGVAVVHRRR